MMCPMGLRSMRSNDNNIQAEEGFISSHLQFTIRNVLLVSFPQKLLATHIYSPASLLLMLMRASTFPSVRLPVFTSVQETDGTGFPVTPQVRFQFSPSTTVMLFSLSIVDLSVYKNQGVLAELPRAQQSTMSNKILVFLCIQEILVLTKSSVSTPDILLFMLADVK